jgi:hypothetical protein
MKKLFIVALLAVVATVHAEDFKYLTMGYNNVEKSITLETIQKITFVNGQVVVATSEGNESFPLAQMQKMYFSQTATGIGEIEKMRDGENEKMRGEVYDLSGRKVSVPSVSSVLPKGVYIINGKKVVK